MKTETKKQIKEKEFDTVKTFRAIKEKISKDIVDMNFEQIKAYLENKKVRVQDGPRLLFLLLLLSVAALFPASTPY